MIKILFFLFQYFGIDKPLSKYLEGQMEQPISVRLAIKLFFFSKMKGLPERTQERLFTQIEPYLQKKLPNSSVITSEFMQLLFAKLEKDNEKIIEVYETKKSFHNPLLIGKDKIQTQCSHIYARALFENGYHDKSLQIVRGISWFQLEGTFNMAAYYSLLTDTKQHVRLLLLWSYIQIRYPFSQMSLLSTAGLMMGYRNKWIYSLIQATVTLIVYWIPWQVGMLTLVPISFFSTVILIRLTPFTKQSSDLNTKSSLMFLVFILSWGFPMLALTINFRLNY